MFSKPSVLVLLFSVFLGNKLGKFAFIQLIAVKTDSFITSPNCPVILSLPLPGDFEVSTIIILPPYDVQAMPIAVPGLATRSSTSFS
jgi:hypothetical protein